MTMRPGRLPVVQVNSVGNAAALLDAESRDASVVVLAITKGAVRAGKGLADVSVHGSC
jgi:hypothetical protein